MYSLFCQVLVISSKLSYIIAQQYEIYHQFVVSSLPFYTYICSSWYAVVWWSVSECFYSTLYYKMHTIQLIVCFFIVWELVAKKFISTQKTIRTKSVSVIWLNYQMTALPNCKNAMWNPMYIFFYPRLGIYFTM